MSFVAFLVRWGLFKGRTLDEELAYVRYFHNHPTNVLLHTIFAHLLLLSFLALVRVVGHHTLDVVVVAAYSIGFMKLDVLTGTLGCIAFVTTDAVLRHIVIPLPYPANIAVVILCAALGGGMQLLGHIHYDKSMPAFRAFEAFFTTPFYLYLSILFRLGYKEQWRRRIEAKTMMWKGSERKIYGERTFH
mmetsp:Transcript_61932/g.91965  ORF Transcript_61932/g.91965 Transcript_61932/m.91965 type:complete len:189 (-) Transcript_61932:613-1179(-)